MSSLFPKRARFPSRKEKLISKKDLLALYEISYGALYRWKRKGLIPEEWFIKKATVTGQETFFPQQLICERVELIKKQKDDVSLDELAKKLSYESNKKSALVIETVFGKKIFYLGDIISISIDDSDGSIKNITNDIIGEK